jgi:hypothetical protein
VVDRCRIRHAVLCRSERESDRLGTFYPRTLTRPTHLPSCRLRFAFKISELAGRLKLGRYHTTSGLGGRALADHDRAVRNEAGPKNVSRCFKFFIACSTGSLASVGSVNYPTWLVRVDVKAIVLNITFLDNLDGPLNRVRLR